MDFQGFYQDETALAPLDGATGVRTAPRLIPFQPIEVYRVGWIAVEDIDDSATVAVQRGTIGGSYTTLDSFVSGGAIDQGFGVYHDLDEPLIVIPGEEMLFNLTEAAAASADVYLFFHYRPIGFAKVGAVQKGDASLFPPSGTPPNQVDTRIIADRLVNLTKVDPV